MSASFFRHIFCPNVRIFRHFKKDFGTIRAFFFHFGKRFEQIEHGFNRIILPQVVKRIIPAVTNEVVTLVKDTSMAFTVAYQEMFTIGKQIANSQTSFMPFVIAGVFYFVFNAIVGWVMGRFEKRLNYYR